MRKKILIVGFILLAALLLSGCVGASAWPGLSASENVAYLANTNSVHAVNVKTGEELWKFSMSGGFLGSSPSLFVTTPIPTEDGLLIVPDSGNKHTIYALDLNNIDAQEKTPAIKWQFSDADGHWIAAPLIVGDRLFAPNADGRLYVLDLQNGAQEIEPIKLSEGDQTDRLWAQPVSDGERLFITSMDHRIFAISLETYEVEWSHQLDAAIPGSPVMGSNGMLYVGSLAKKLERFDPVTGDHESVLTTNDWVWGTPVADGDTLYFSDVQGYFYSYNAAEEKLNWEPIKLDGAITASPLIVGDQVLLATESGDVYSVSKDGSKYGVWYHPDKEGKAYTTPALADDHVLVAYLESDYYLVILNANGVMQRTFPN